MNLKNKWSISNLILTVLFVWSTVTHSQTKSLFKIKLAERPTGVIFPTIYFHSSNEGWIPFHKGLCEEMTTEEKSFFTDYVNVLKPTEKIVDACEYAECVFHPAVYVSPIDFKIMRYAGVVIEKNMDILNYKLGKFLESRWSCEVGGNPDLEYRSIPTLENIDYDMNALQSTCQKLTPSDFKIIREDRKIFKDLFGDGKKIKPTAFKLFFDVLLSPAFALGTPDFFGELSDDELSSDSEMNKVYSERSPNGKEIALEAVKEKNKANEVRMVKHVDYCNNAMKGFIKDAMISYENGENVRALTNIGFAEQNLEAAFQTASEIDNQELRNITISRLEEEKAKLTKLKNTIQHGGKVGQDLYKKETEAQETERNIEMNLHEISRKEEDPDFKVTKVSVEHDGSIKKEEWEIPTQDNATNYEIIPDELKKELVTADLNQELEARGLSGISQKVKDALISKVSSLKNIDFDQLLGKKVKGGLEKIKLLKDKLANRAKLGITLPPKVQQKYEKSISKINQGLALTNSKIQNAGQTVSNQTHKWKNNWSNNKGKLGEKNNSSSFNYGKGKESNNAFNDKKGGYNYNYNYNYNNFGNNIGGDYNYNHYSNNDKKISNNKYSGASSSNSFDNKYSAKENKDKKYQSHSSNSKNRKTFNNNHSNINSERKFKSSHLGNNREVKSRSNYSSGSSGTRPSSSNYSSQLASVVSGNSLQKDLTSIRERSKNPVLEINKSKMDQKEVQNALKNILDKIDTNYSKIKNKKLSNQKNGIVTKEIKDMKCLDKKYFLMGLDIESWHSVHQLMTTVREMKPNNKFCIFDDENNSYLEMELVGNNIIAGYRPNFKSPVNVNAEELNKELKEGLVYFGFLNLYLFEVYQRKGIIALTQKLREIKREDLLNTSN
jgi:hypothetical protein